MAADKSTHFPNKPANPNNKTARWIAQMLLFFVFILLVNYDTNMVKNTGYWSSFVKKA